jgi:hypothetical protein
MSKNITNDAERWLDGEISLGKLLQIIGCSRPSGDDLAGAISNAYSERIQCAYAKIEAEAKRAKSEYDAEEKANDSINAAASSAAHRAYIHALSILNFETHAAVSNV